MYGVTSFVQSSRSPGSDRTGEGRRSSLVVESYSLFRQQSVEDLKHTGDGKPTVVSRTGDRRTGTRVAHGLRYYGIPTPGIYEPFQETL